FYPPSIDNTHDDQIENGRNRTDIAVQSSTIEIVQQAYDAARQQNPDDVIVLHLTGDFDLDGPPLALGSDTAVILDGTIRVTSRTAHQAITASNPVAFLSLSGGTVDCAGRVMEGVVIPMATMVVLVGMTVTHCGEQQTRSTSNAIHFQRGS